jgi:uncharacterized protein YndB with AHSA1/START domain
MGPVSAEIEIDAPRERVFEAIGDLSRRLSFTDHFVCGFHLTRIESEGVGAGARFRFALPLRSIWVDTTIAELDPFHTIVERGRGGRGNRVPVTTAWELTGGGSLTRVRISHWTEPANPIDRGLELLSGAAIWQRRGWREALRRLRNQLESSERPSERVLVAGGNPHATGIP